jgi:lysophospholipid acyltransferase (LPLAT)-like uncharacterized protein
MGISDFGFRISDLPPAHPMGISDFGFRISDLPPAHPMGISNFGFAACPIPLPSTKGGRPASQNRRDLGVESTTGSLGENKMTSRPFTSRYLVDDVPLVLRPFHTVFSYCLALFLFAVARLIYFTSKIEIVGREHLKESSNHIYCYWHVFSPLALGAFFRPRRHVWMQHPGWLNKHMHIAIRMFGVEKVVLGSTGYGGREAADEIVEDLKRGYSTVVFPDAPRGPTYVLKDGALHMSLKSGVPIAPARFFLSKYVELRGWDRKRFPYLFSTIRVEFKDPIQVTEENFDEARERLREALGVPDGPIEELGIRN